MSIIPKSVIIELCFIRPGYTSYYTEIYLSNECNLTKDFISYLVGTVIGKPIVAKYYKLPDNDSIPNEFLKGDDLLHNEISKISFSEEGITIDEDTCDVVDLTFAIQSPEIVNIRRRQAYQEALSFLHSEVKRLENMTI